MSGFKYKKEDVTITCSCGNDINAEDYFQEWFYLFSDAYDGEVDIRCSNCNKWVKVNRAADIHLKYTKVSDD